MSIWGNVMSAARVGLEAAIQEYNERNMVPAEEYGWDDYKARLARYWVYSSYRNNTAYSSINRIASRLKASSGLYKNIRGIYNPVYRQNQLLVSYIYGGSIDMETLTGGAIPVVTSNAALIEAIKQLFVWSRFAQNKSLYTRHGALLGDVALKIIDDREHEKVRLEVLHPGKIRDVEVDAVGNVQSIIIEYERPEELDVANMRPSRLGTADLRSNITYTYTEKITKDKFQTFKNGSPFAFYKDMSGKPVAEWDNEYGFVPVSLCQHQPSGLKWGENAFHASTRKVDEINDQASLLNDQVRKVIVPLLFVSGAGGKKDLTVDTSDRDRFTIIYAPEGSDIKNVIGDIDIEGASANIDKMLQELERDLPELALQRMRESGGDQTAPGVTAAYSDAVGRVEEARGNYDGALVRAIQMAVTMGGLNSYRGFESFNLQSYDAGNIDFYIKDRPVINDSLSLLQRLTSLGTVNSMTPALQRVAMQEMGYDEKTIDSVVLDAEKQTHEAARGFANSVFGSGDDDENVDEEDEEEVIADEEALAVP